MSSFTHIDDEGRSRMVDITDKEPTLRSAVAQGVVSMEPSTFEMIHNNSIKKGAHTGKPLQKSLLLIKIILQYRRPLSPKPLELPAPYRIPHLPEEFHKKVEVMCGIQPHREDLPAHKEMPQIGTRVVPAGITAAIRIERAVVLLELLPFNTYPALARK